MLRRHFIRNCLALCLPLLTGCDNKPVAGSTTTRQAGLSGLKKFHDPELSRAARTVFAGQQIPAEVNALFETAGQIETSFRNYVARDYLEGNVVDLAGGWQLSRTEAWLHYHLGQPAS